MLLQLFHLLPIFTVYKILESTRCLGGVVPLSLALKVEARFISAIYV